MEESGVDSSAIHLPDLPTSTGRNYAYALRDHMGAATQLMLEENDPDQMLVWVGSS